MSHPNPQHDKGNEYPEDNHKGKFSMKSGTGGLAKDTRKYLGINEMLTTDMKASVKAGKANAKEAALKAKQKKK